MHRAIRKDANELHRRVRSFVRRGGRLTEAQQRALDELWPGYGIEFSAERLPLETLFAQSAPCVLEIGFGNGETLVAQASGDPARNYLGIEVHEPGIGHCLIRAHDAGITNLRLIAHDAIEVLEEQLTPASLARINLYFPDPWPKKRHHKRRIIQPYFLALCASRLEAHGALHIATDWADYAEHIDELVAESADFVCGTRREHDGSEPADRPVTKFERRGLKLGHRIWDWRLDRKA